ncbi:TPA: hypothetical protein ACTZ52_005384 [Bacillus cereus]
MNVKELLSLVGSLKVPSPYYEVLAVFVVILAFWFTYETIMSHRLDNQKKRLENKLLEKKLSQPENTTSTPSAPTPGEETNL